tara:strand:- start:403 stop:780 length:378 start_codon:yes stop_codon:yes gene_type:complete
MGLIDTTFSSIPAKILDKWGENLTFIKSAAAQTYNASTGVVSGADTNVSIKAIITQVSPSETDGNRQATDLQIIFGNKELGDYYPTVRDRIQYTESGATKVARIMSVNTSRGDKPIMHTVVARPQ